MVGNVIVTMNTYAVYVVVSINEFIDLRCKKILVEIIESF